MGEEKKIRLSKAAREFNVGLSTIIGFLHKKGFDLDLNPNSKISGEIYEILANEYSSEARVKKESEKLSFIHGSHRNHLYLLMILLLKKRLKRKVMRRS